MDASPSPRPDGGRRRSPALRIAVALGVAAVCLGVVGLVLGLGGPVTGPVGFTVTTAVGATILVACGVGWLVGRVGGRTGPFA